MKTRKLGALILGSVMGLTALCTPALATDAPVSGSAQGKYSLTVSAGTETDIENAGVVLDLYYVASAAADERYDTYHYTMEPAYGALSIPENITNDGWNTLAQQAAQLALGGESPLSPAVSGLPAGEKAEGLESGLYLVIARGETEDGDYVTNLHEGEENVEAELVTTAKSYDYVYTYAPQLVTLPGKAAAEDGSVGTAVEYGDWLNDMSITLKPAQSIRYGSLIIEKTVSGFGGEPAVFLFRIEGSREDGARFSDVVAITFTAAGTDTYTVERIPVGAEVTVTEIYTGASYTLTSDNDQTAIIPAEDAASVAFTNTYNGSANSGSAVVNHFQYMGEEQGWDWNGSTSRAPQD